MATGKRVVAVSHRKPKRDRAQKIRTLLNESTVASVASGEAMEARPCGGCFRCFGEPRFCDGTAKDRTVTDGIGVVRLDPALLAMLRENVAVIRKSYADVWHVETWDAPPDWTVYIPGLTPSDVADLIHAIGFIAGAAAMMDLTPCMLIENLGL